MTGRAVLLTLLLAACGEAPGVDRNVDAARLDATTRKAVADVDAAQREAKLSPAEIRLSTLEQTSR